MAASFLSSMISDSRRWRQLPLAAALLAIALGGCSANKGVSGETTGNVAKPLTTQDFEKSLAYWGDRYAKKSKDEKVALNYAAALQRLGRTEQAVAVLQKAAIEHPDDRVVLAAYGKSLAAGGDFNRALGILDRAQTPEQPDAKLLSAQAAILDQLGRHDEARKLYAESLKLAPNEAATMSNYGMSYVLSGDLGEAERILRQAAAMPGADSRVRQNLALAVGLSGRFDEAQQIASAELPPAEAAENVAYLKTMLSQQNNWKSLKSQKVAALTN